MNQSDKPTVFLLLFALSLFGITLGLALGVWLTAHGKIKLWTDDGRPYICAVKDKS